jgi:spermidine/putrescine-binding protein
VSGVASGLAKSFGLFLALLALTFVLTGYFRGAPTGRRVNLYIWSSYLGPDTLKNFTERTGIHVDYDLYDSNETLHTKLASGNVEYDVVVPSDYMVEILVKEGLLAPIDRSKLANFKNVDPSFLKLRHDPETRWSIPFVPGTTGIGYRKDKVQGPVDSWKALWDPRYKNRILMLDDMRECFGVALKSAGASLNTTDPAQLKAARELLMQQKPLIKEYNSSNFQDLLISGEAWLAHGYNGQIAKAAREYPFIGYAIPREGCTRSLDNLCIPARAPHQDEAHQLIDYLLDAKVAAQLCMYTSYTTANRAAREHLLPEVRENPTIFPPESALAACEFIHDVGPALRRYDQYWTEVKAKE